MPWIKFPVVTPVLSTASPIELSVVMDIVHLHCPIKMVAPRHFLGGVCAGSDGKESAYNTGDPTSIPGLGKSPGKRKGYSLHYSGLENSMDCIAYGVAMSPRLGNLHFHFGNYTKPGQGGARGQQLSH